MVRVVLIPFTTTPHGQQLNGADRDTADDKVAHAILNAGRSAVEMIKMGATLRNAYDDEFPDVIARDGAP